MSTVDCSRYQGVLSVPLLQGWKAAGVTRVILKAGGGNSGRYEDSLWATNSANVRATGLLLEAYWFNGTTDPAGDAAFVNSFVPSGIRVWADVESEGSMPHWSDDQADVFETGVIARGHPSGTYMSASVTFGSWPKCSRRPLWVAGYGFTSTPAVGNWRAPVLWQYTSTGHLPGYAGNLDLDTDLAGVADVSASPIIIPTVHEEDDMTIYRAVTASTDGRIGKGYCYVQDAAGPLRAVDNSEGSVIVAKEAKGLAFIADWNGDDIRSLITRVGILEYQAMPAGAKMSNGTPLIGPGKLTGRIIYDNATLPDYPKVTVA